MKINFSIKALKWSFVRQPENFFSRATSMPVVSISIDLHDLQFKNGKLDIDGAEKWFFWGVFGSFGFSKINENQLGFHMS